MSLATREHAYTLSSDRVPGLEVRIRIEPLIQPPSSATIPTPAASQIARYRRSISVVNRGHEELGVVAVTRVNLAERRFIDNEAMGFTVLGEHCESLPEQASIGNGGHWALARSTSAGSAATVSAAAGLGAAGQAPTRIEWVLEPWKPGQALWCLNIDARGSGGPISSECYVIRPDGDVIGAALRLTLPPAAAEAVPGRSSSGTVVLASAT